MGSINPNRRVSIGLQQDFHGHSISNKTSSSSPSSANIHNSDNSKEKLTNFLPLFLALVVIAEIGGSSGGKESCEEWLEREAYVVYSRDFRKEHVLIAGREETQTCRIGSHVLLGGSLGFTRRTLMLHLVYIRWDGWRSSVNEIGSLLSQEGDLYGTTVGYDIIMTTSLSSDVPVGYFSWAEYDIMAPVQPKTEKVLAAIFISNCAACNFRLQALKGLEKLNVKD